MNEAIYPLDPRVQYVALEAALRETTTRYVSVRDAFLQSQSDPVEFERLRRQKDAVAKELSAINRDIDAIEAYLQIPSKPASPPCPPE